MEQTISHKETKFLHFFFSFLENEKIKYVVIRNYKTLPEAVSGTDIDIIIDRKQYAVFRKKLINEVGHIGYKLWKEYPKNFDIIQMSFTPETCQNPQDIIRIDFIQDNVKWLGFDMIDINILLNYMAQYNGISVLKNPVKTALTFLNIFLYGGDLKKKYQFEYKSLQREDSIWVDKYLADSFGDYGKKVIEKIHNGKVEDLNVRKMRYYFLKSKRFEARFILQGFNGLIKTGLYRTICPPGIFVTLVGPDGSGKSTISEMICNKSKRMYAGTNHFHLYPKPSLFIFFDKISHSRWGKRQKKSSEWELRKQKNHIWKSFIRSSYILLRFWAGYLLWIYPRLMKGHLIIGERWNFDLLFDPASKGITLPYWLRKFIFLLCPASQRTIALCGSAQEMATRKRELPLEEISRQIKMIKEKLSGNHNVTFIDSTESVDKTFRKVLQVLCA